MKKTIALLLTLSLIFPPSAYSGRPLAAGNALGVQAELRDGFIAVARYEARLQATIGMIPRSPNEKLTKMLLAREASAMEGAAR